MDNKLLRFDKTSTFVVIDAETQNLALHETLNLPWQIAFLKVKGEEIIDQFSHFIRYPFEIKVSVGAAKITHYNPNEVKREGIAPEKAYPHIIEALQNADWIIGHNIIGFDLYVLNGFFRFLGKPEYTFTNKLIDTACLAKGIKMGIPYKFGESLINYQYRVYHKFAKGVKYSLTVLGKEYGIEHDYDNLHNALVDIELGKKVWDKLKWQVEI